MKEFSQNCTMFFLFLVPVALSGGPDIPHLGFLMFPNSENLSSIQSGILPDSVAVSGTLQNCDLLVQKL